MPRGRHKGHVSTGPIEMVGLLNYCEHIAKHKLRLPVKISDRDRADRLAVYFREKPIPWKNYRTRCRDWLGDHDLKADTLRRQLRIARKIRIATPTAWNCFATAITKMYHDRPDIAPEKLIATGMLSFVIFGIVDENEVETFYANLSALYHRPNFYMGTWASVVREIKKNTGVGSLTDLRARFRR